MGNTRVTERQRRRVAYQEQRDRAANQKIEISMAQKLGRRLTKEQRQLIDDEPRVEKNYKIFKW